MKCLRFLLGDQLSRQISALRDIDAAEDVVLMAEVESESTYVRHHRQKIVFVLSAMRHFARRLRDQGIKVDYVKLDDQGNTGALATELCRALRRHTVDRVVVTEPGEWRLWADMQTWSEKLGTLLEIRDDDRFLCTRAEFARWAAGRRELRMELFYRRMRRTTGWLMEGGKPVGGSWNFDRDNRKALPRHIKLPARTGYPPDQETREVMRLVEKRFDDHFGALQSFQWAVTREQALAELKGFVDACLPQFGEYQDAMKSGSDSLFHALISPYINIGLLEPREVCLAVLAAFESGAAPLPAVEGFVRQILGWREFIRGVYWLKAPDYGRSNYFDAHRALPGFFWTAETRLNCLRQSIETTRRRAYAHHIQRLMITGNFALLAGIEPAQVEEWYLIVYADAFEWVELPNTHGMALFADGGLLSSKPYAASGAYINRMSDYCTGCCYDPKLRLGDNACPFNFLYWNFLIAQRSRLAHNPRMAIIYRILDRIPATEQRKITAQASEFLQANGIR